MPAFGDLRTNRSKLVETGLDEIERLAHDRRVIAERLHELCSIAPSDSRRETLKLARQRREALAALLGVMGRLEAAELVAAKLRVPSLEIASAKNRGYSRGL